MTTVSNTCLAVSVTVSMLKIYTFFKNNVQVEKYGHPNGIVRFDGVSLVPREFNEPPPNGHTTVEFPLKRREGVLGEIQVIIQLVKYPSIY